MCNNNNSNTYTFERDTKIRYDNLNEKEMPEGEKYIVDWEGYEYVRCWIPMHKLKDGRKRFLLSYATNFIWLNPNLQYEKYIWILSNVNQVAFEIPLTSERIQSTLNSVIRQRREGKLIPILYKYKRKIIFNSNAQFEKRDKQDIVIQELALKKTEDSKSKVKSMLNSWEKEFGFVTARKLFEIRDKLGQKISYKTICKYYKSFKTEIKTINENVRGEQEDTINAPKSRFVFTEIYKFQYEVDNFKIIDYWNPTKNYISSKNESSLTKMNLQSDVISQIKAIFRQLKLNLTDRKEQNDEIEIVIFRAVKKIASLDNSINAERLYKQILSNCVFYDFTNEENLEWM